MTEPEIKELLYSINLTILRFYYGYYLKILDAFCDDSCFLKDETLNHYYQFFTNAIDRLLSFDEFTELAKEKPTPFLISLIGDIFDANVWHEAKHRYEGFMSNIDSLYYKSGVAYFEVDSGEGKKEHVTEIVLNTKLDSGKTIKDHLIEIDEYLNQYNEIKQKEIAKIFKQVDKTSKQRIQIEQKNEDITSNLQSLKDIKIDFTIEKDNPSNGYLILGDKSKLYTSDTFKYHVCKYMISNKRIKVGKPYSWDLIYPSYDPNANLTVDIDKKQTSIYNAVYGINEDIQGMLGTEEELLIYENKSVIRNF